MKASMSCMFKNHIQHGQRIKITCLKMTYKLKRPFEVKSSNKGELTKFGPEFIN